MAEERLARIGGGEEKQRGEKECAVHDDRELYAGDGSECEARVTPPEEARRVAGGPSEASDHRFTNARCFPAAAAVAERIHAGWYLVRDSCRSRENGRHCIPVVSRFARGHRLPYVPPPEAFSSPHRYT